MSKRKIIQLIAIFFLGLAIILLIPNTEWNEKSSVFGFISLVLGTLGSVISIFIPTSFTFHFDDIDWIFNKTNEDYSIIIKSKKHGLGKSLQIQTFMNNSTGYQEVGVSSNQDKKGNITIKAKRTFKGKVIVS